MFKFLLIMALTAYLFYKIGGMFFRAGAASQQYRQQQRHQDTASNVNSGAARDKKSGTIKGGDYVDFEEIK